MEWDTREWLETDGLGGFASGTVCGLRTRRYHAILLPATMPPTGRRALVNGFDAWVKTPAGKFPISSQRYAPDVIAPEGTTHLAHFEPDPWPQWVFVLPDGTRIIQELFVPHGTPAVAVAWRSESARGSIFLEVRPFFSGRDYHALHHENAAFRFKPDEAGEALTWRPYDGVPALTAVSNGAYHHQPHWYRQFLYEEERQRGLDYLEDLASPGFFQWDLTSTEAVLLFGVDKKPSWPPARAAAAVFQKLRQAEKRRRKQFASRLDRASNDYLVHRGKGTTILAGYPWFTDWGRDTFIALRGLCLATGRLAEARQIIFEWADALSEGMLPNRFTETGEVPDFNSVDASLWYIVAIDAFLKACEFEGTRIPGRDQTFLRQTIDAILTAYTQGTRYHIQCDEDGLLSAGESGVALTWMDAKVGDWVVTPRIGKPVEVQALWLNALWIGSAFSEPWERLFVRGRDSFRQRFWNEAVGALYDVIDVDHQPGATDASLRPNQVFAVGGLPIALLSGEKARRVVETLEEHLLTPIGLRSLAAGSPGYAPRYEGGVRERDGAYHQGTVWPWLMGPFVEAWIRVKGATPDTIREARARFLGPLLAHLDQAGINHVSEIADAEPPHALRGCPFQAWSLAELLRLDRVILAADVSAKKADAVKPSLVQTVSVG